VFLVNLPIGIAALVVGWRRLPRVPGQPIERPDPLGVVLVTGGVAALTLGLVKGGDWGWDTTSVVLTLTGAGVLIALFVVHCLRSSNPLIHPSLFASRRFSGASLIALSFSASFGAMLLSVVLWEQGVWRWSALHAGLALAPGPAMVPIVSFGIAGRLITRYGPAFVISAGSVAFAVGVASWAVAIHLQPNYWSEVLAGMVLTGVGVGLTLPTIMATASSELPSQSFATGSAVVNMIRQAGLAFGVAILVAILGKHTGPGPAALSSFRTAWWVIAAISLVGLAPAAVLLTRRAANTAANAHTGLEGTTTS
jgi:MFS family permease